MKMNRQMESNHNPFRTYIKGILSAYLFALSIFLIMALLITYTNISESIIPLVTSVVLIISSSISGMYAGAKLRRKGWFNGAMIGFVYIITIVLLSWIFINDFSFDKGVLFKSLTGIIAGGIGGMIGVNLK